MHHMAHKYNTVLHYTAKMSKQVQPPVIFNPYMSRKQQLYIKHFVNVLKK